MSTRIMDYDFSGMNSEIRISIIGKKGIDIKMKKMLVVYYSWSNGNTKKIAEQLANKTGADIARIETAEPYSGSHVDVVEQ